MNRELRAFLLEAYSPEDFPCLYQQWEDWEETKPLAGKRILDATPIFRNTLLKHEALMSAGAELVLGVHPQIPHDPEILKLLPQFQIEATDSPRGNFDLVLDCGGYFSFLQPRLGVCELTRTGWQAYKDSSLPVFLADAGKLKAMETSLGTGDGFFRAMAQLCDMQDWKGRHCVLIGYGKVGYGIASAILRAGARLTVIDLPEVEQKIPDGVQFISSIDRAGVEQLLMDCFVAVTAIGQAGVVQSLCDAKKVSSSAAYFANMGMEDEWGEGFARERILNDKSPLNFILSEPTRVNYIEAVMALHNAGALELCKKSYPGGISVPPCELEEALLERILSAGCIHDEVYSIFGR